MDKMRPVPVPVHDRLEIMELMALYAWSYDTGSASGLRSTFTEDGVLDVFGTVQVHAAECFDGFIEQALRMKGDHGWQHLTDHHVFRDYDPSRCTVYSYYTMAQSNAEGGAAVLRAMGYYVSLCRKTAQGWRFARRTVVRWDGKAPFLEG